MKALVFLGPNSKAVEARPKPVVKAPTDAIVQMTMTTICGTDLHILKGAVPSCQPGRILGHEGIGVIDNVGAAVTRFKPGEKVLISCISSCGKCHRRLPVPASMNWARGLCAGC
jgi:alcohol dehydrogenase